MKANLDEIKSWGCNVVRLHTCVQWWVENSTTFTDEWRTVTYPTPFRERYEDVIRWAGERGLYVIVEFYNMKRTSGQETLPWPPHSQHSDVILYFLVGALVGPVAEELFFRGLLYGFFRRWGVVVAVILSTLLFVLPHAVQQRIPITQVVGGIVFAVAYEVEGSLMVPIIIHVLGNMAIFSITLWA